MVILTSNRTRELHDALKRRCLYHWIEYPDRAREAEIVARAAAGGPGRDRRARVRGGRRGCAARSSTSSPASARRSPGPGRSSRSTTPATSTDDRRGAEGARGHRAGAGAGGARGCLRSLLGSARAGSSWPPCRSWRARCGARVQGRGRGAARGPSGARGGGPGRPRAGAIWRCGSASAQSSVDLRRFDEAWLALLSATSNQQRATSTRSPPRSCPASRYPTPPGAARSRATGELAPVGGERRSSCCATKDFAEYTDHERAWPARCMPGSRAAGRRGAGAGRAGAAAPPRGARPDARPTARRAAPRGRAARAPLARAGPAPPPAGLGLRRLGLDGALRADAARLRARLRAGAQALRGVRVQHPPDPDHPRARRPRPRRRPRPAPPTRPATGRAGRGSARRSRSSTASTGGGSGAARSSPCSPTAGIAASRSCSRPRSSGSGRCSHRLVWLNPLKATPGYEPLVRGMQAALPHVDLFLAGNTLGSLEQLAASMERGFERAAERGGEDERGARRGRGGARGDRVALATVVGCRRSAPRPAGAKMAINEHGQIAGAVSGGCVEGASRRRPV